MTKDFFRYASIRALRTICQTAIAIISTSAVVLSDVDWMMVLSASALSGILSVLTSIATGLPEVDYAEHIHMSKEEPEDSWIDEYEVFDYGDEIGIEEGDYDGKE